MNRKVLLTLVGLVVVSSAGIAYGAAQLTITMTSGQTDNPVLIENNTGTDLFWIDSSGNLNLITNGKLFLDGAVNDYITSTGNNIQFVQGGNTISLPTGTASAGTLALTSQVAQSLVTDVTCTATATYCTVFTIPLTASSGNNINVQLIADSNTTGVAIQTRARGDDAEIQGFCVHRVYVAATVEALDVLTVTGTPADTTEITWLPAANVPIRLTIECSVETDATTPQNLIVDIQMEAAATGTIQKGSYYFVTPPI